jgi:hypothetical protein
MTVEATGKGMPGGLLALLREKVPLAPVRGLRHARMVERLHRVGGKLEIKSGVGKMIVKADIPVNDQQVAPPELALDPL